MVLDYITTNAYLSTARCLSENHLDDGSEEAALASGTRAAPLPPLPMDGDITMDIPSLPDPAPKASERIRRLDKAALEMIERRHSTSHSRSPFSEVDMR